MVSDAELVERLQEFLRTSDLNTTTTAIVRRQLEQDFNVDLTEKKAFIREQVDLFLQSQLENEKEGLEEGNEGKGKQDSSEGEEEEEDESEDEDEGGKEGGKEGESRKGVVTKKGGGTGFTKLCGLSPELQKFLGASELPRTEVVKQLWVYIRENNLQDPNNRRNINCDKKLRTLFDVDSINMFQMNKVLSTHIHSLGTNNVGPDKPAQKEKPRKQERRGPDESIPKKKRPKGESSGTTAFLAPLPLSDALVKFIGTGESKLPRSEVVKRMWNYIKENKLQDPADKRRIICDEKLKELFEVDSFVGFTAPKLLVPHLNPKKMNRE